MFNQYHYLYVEDDAPSRQIMELIVKNVMGVTSLTIFEDSQNFTEKLLALEHPIDIALLDIHIRPYDGFEMLAQMRKQEAFAHTKIIALTASVMNQEVARLRQSGFNGAIAKPISIQTFPQLIKKVIDNESVWVIT